MAHPERESFLLEYDEYARLENELIFVVGDLETALRALQSEDRVPELLARQLCRDLLDMKQSAEKVERVFHFSFPLDALHALFAEWDSLSHATLGEIVKKHDIPRLQHALKEWAARGVIARWLQGTVYGLRRMGRLLLVHMDELLKQADSSVS